ncbi:MAG: MBL fold metallo-hydrolase [Lentisphaerae bacterium]|nr:MBL fold metallo-hydrolase [Lentisphaerota bacterium]
MPACGSEYLRYGGNTTCFSISTEDGLIIVDAGTGITHVAADIARNDKILPITMLFTHFHMDHVVGLPAFEPLYDHSSDIIIMADPRRDHDWKNAIRTFTGKPYWPIGLSDTAAGMHLNDLPVREDTMECYGIRVSWFRVPHPQQCLAYKIKMLNCTVVIATDVEYTRDSISKGFVEFCRNANHLIFDTQYTPAEIEKKRGWGHSTWEVATDIARAADIQQLVMTHHEPKRTDDELDRIVDQVRESFPSTVAATENMILG